MRKTLNRDVNAALNILYIFKEESLHGYRPVKFTLTFQTELRRAAIVS